MSVETLPASGVTAKGAGLKPSCLNFSEVMAQAIALISPTMTAALIVPTMFGQAGSGSWLAYAFGTVMLLFVALNLNQFARRSTSAGSMYAYTTRGLGPAAGGLSGWCLIWAYLFIGVAGLTGFTNFVNVIAGMTGHHFPPTLIFALCAAAAWYLAYKDIQFSTILMLILEGASVALILVLAWIVLFQHGVPIDHAQLSLKGASLSGMSLGVVTAIFSLVGFECATAFGDEAKNPLKTIPKAVIWSLLLTGTFFVIVTYTEVYGLRGSKTTLDQLTAPLNNLADLAHVGFLKIPLSLGAMISFFSLALSCLNACSRIMYPMGRHGVFHASIGQAHKTNETPHVAATVTAILMFSLAAGLMCFKIQDTDAFGYAGTFGAFGFLFAYFLITIAAPAYLKREGQLRPGHVVLAVVTVIFLLVPAVGSVYPVPAPPVKYFPYLFLAYFAAGGIWFATMRKRSPQVIVEIERDLEESHGQYRAHREEPLPLGGTA